MAIIVGKEQKLPFTGALKDSRAEGYVSYFTKAGWDRWKMAAASVERDIADRDKEYDAAIDIYNQQLKDLEDKRAGLEKKLVDIQAKAAAADIKREDAKWKAEEARKVKRQEQETEKNKGVAKEPSTSTSTGASYTDSGGGVYSGRGGSTKDPFDEAMDEITPANRTNVDDRLRTLNQGEINSSNVGDRWIKLGQLQDTVLNADPYTKGMTAYAFFINSKDALRLENPSMNDADLTAKVLGVMSPGQKADVAYGKSMVDKKAAEQTGGGGSGGGTYSPSSGSSRGSYQTDYDIAGFDQEVADLDKLGVTYKQIEDDLTKQLDVANKKNIKVPTFEKVDLITATRKAYDDKFGDIPRGTMLQTASGNTYTSELQPYELTNALNKTEKFFKLYIEAEVNAATDAKGSPLNTDEQNAAVEAGKKRARDILFGGLGTPPKTPPTSTAPEAFISAEQGESGGEPTSSPLPGLKTAPIRIPPNDTSESASAGGAAGSTSDTEATRGPLPLTTLVPGPTSSGITVTEGGSGGTGTSLPLPGLKTYGPRQPFRQSELDALFPNGVPQEVFDAASKMQRNNTIPVSRPQMQNYGGTAPIPPADGRRFDGPGPNIGQKTDGEIQSYGGATPNVAPTRPANIPYELPATGLRPPYHQTDKWIPPPLWEPTRQPGLMPVPTDLYAPATYIEPTKEEIDSQLYWKNKRKEEQKAKPANSQDQESLNDRRIKTEAVIAGSSLAIENPKKAAATITKDSIGKYVASLYDTNKQKGANGQPVGKISEAILREYSNDPAKQKKALEILASLSMLDSSAGKIRVA